jgi:hypothetical protein
MEFFANGLGIEHITTSAYTPSTNEITERSNQTIIEMLRILCESNPNDWDLWLHFVCIAFNSKIHTTTKYSPSELTFARECNHFSDYTNDDTDLNACIIQRTNEIKSLYEEKIPDAMLNLKNQQSKQINSQNKQHVITDKPLPIGSCVYLKCEGIINKLEPKFKAPYFIIKQAKRMNYRLKDALGEELDCSYPLHKLKPIAIDSSLRIM